MSNITLINIKFFLIFYQFVFDYICNMELYEKIVQIREARRISRAEMATALNMSSQSYWNIETGKTEVTVSRLRQIGEILGVTVTDLLTGEAQKVEDTEEVEGLRRRVRELEEDKKNLNDLVGFYQEFKEVANFYKEYKNLKLQDKGKAQEFLDNFLKESSKTKYPKGYEPTLSEMLKFHIALHYLDEDSE